MQRSELKTKKIGVLYGGMNSEREVSLETGQAAFEALKARGYDVVLIDQGRDLPAQLTSHGIEVAFVALHGKWGEDGGVQGVLEVMGIPYTGSGIFASALALDKQMSKIAFREAGISVAPYRMATPGDLGNLSEDLLPFPLPAVVKPNSDGSSVGISIVREPEDLRAALEYAFNIESRVMIEQYIAGREIQVTVLDGKALGAIWVKPAREFYDYEAKYLTDDTEYIYPAPLSSETYERCLESAARAYRSLRCRGVARIDLIVGDDDSIVILELNTMPGLTSHSLVPKTAAAEGIPFEELMERMLEGASLELHAPKAGRKG